ncbi:galactosylceramide sulfotransferase-like [Ptychodera flava]|uniref:galactosylceramide sulfotransferase-like n=1 Tax=Ptychodera flava TaxID=63121 RepID=UPI00396A88EB
MDFTVKTCFICVILISLTTSIYHIARLNFSSIHSRVTFEKNYGWLIPFVVRNSSGALKGRSILCRERTQIVFIKTHKTASSTTNSIIQRFGYNRGLAFALPKKGHIFTERYLFSRKLLLHQRPPENRTTHFNIIASHLRYNRPELDQVVPNATYITILRNPIQRFESAFGYYNFARTFKLTNSKTPLEDFMKNADKYFNKSKGGSNGLLRNGMSSSFGFDHRFDDNDSAINEMIEKLDKELDLVMISDYYEESLVLLKRLLCWGMDDILYISKGIRSKNRRYDMSQSLAQKIIKWNKADVKLFNHFNSTFWKRVNSYGKHFYEDLSEFRTRLQQFHEECVDTNKTKRIQGREDGIVMKTNTSIQCKLAFKRDTEFHTILRNEAIEKYNITVKKTTNTSAPIGNMTKV